MRGRGKDVEQVVKGRQALIAGLLGAVLGGGAMLVAAPASMGIGERPRIEAAHAALDGELRLFLNQLEPLWSAEKMAADHAALVRGLERDGPAVLRAHLAESAATLVAAGRDAGRPGRVGDPPAR